MKIPAASYDVAKPLFQRRSVAPFVLSPHTRITKKKKQLTNNRTDRPTDLYLTLDSLSLVSRHYSLEPLPGQFSTSAELGNVLQIGWQERMTVHYRVVPHKEASKVCLLSECPFTEKSQSISKKCVDSDATDYLRLERASESFEVSRSIAARPVPCLLPPLSLTFTSQHVMNCLL